jgi:hypothetical protein
MMIEFLELDGIDSGGGTGSVMFNIAEYDVFSMKLIFVRDRAVPILLAELLIQDRIIAMFVS